eukprot:2043937-Rhodomonas_salina.1
MGVPILDFALHLNSKQVFPPFVFLDVKKPNPCLGASSRHRDTETQRHTGTQPSRHTCTHAHTQTYRRTDTLIQRDVYLLCLMAPPTSHRQLIPRYTAKSNTSNHIPGTNCTEIAVACV